MKTSIRHDAVAGTIARMALSTEAMATELETLDTAVTSLSDSWDGEARDAYLHAQAEWTNSIRRMKHLLSEATRRLVLVNAISMETSTTAARVWD